jgi:hypothetical protein
MTKLILTALVGVSLFGQAGVRLASGTAQPGSVIDLGSGKLMPPKIVYASLPAAASNEDAVYIVTDANADCSGGGGTGTPCWMRSDGANWGAVGGGAGSGISTFAALTDMPTCSVVSNEIRVSAGTVMFDTVPQAILAATIPMDAFAGSTTFYVYIPAGGTQVRVGHGVSTGQLGTLTAADEVTGVTSTGSIPYASIALCSVPATSGTLGAVTNLRHALKTTKYEFTGVTATQSGGVVTVPIPAAAELQFEQLCSFPPVTGITATANTADIPAVTICSVAAGTITAGDDIECYGSYSRGTPGGADNFGFKPAWSVSGTTAGAGHEVTSSTFTQGVKVVLVVANPATNVQTYISQALASSGAHTAVTTNTQAATTGTVDTTANALTIAPRVWATGTLGTNTITFNGGSCWIRRNN